MTTILPTPPIAAEDLKCTCADWWGHPAVQLLVGDALRPGGTALTSTLLDQAELPSASRVLDIGSGTGATLELLDARGHAAIGIDRGSALASLASARAAVAVGDAERLPFADAAFDAITMECVLSALPDKRAATDEVHRVLRPGGMLLLTDMSISGRLPEPLDTLAAWVACAAGALDAAGYRALLADQGFDVEGSSDHADALRAFVAKARRRLALIEGAIKVGIVPDPEAMLGPELDALRDTTSYEGDLAVFGREMLGAALDSVLAGELGYTAVRARRI